MKMKSKKTSIQVLVFFLEEDEVGTDDDVISSDGDFFPKKTKMLDLVNFVKHPS